MSKVKKIGVLTSGGDAPGMNAAVRAVVRTAAYHGIESVAVFRGYEGLMEKNFKTLGPRDVANILGRGGTMLYSARSEEFNTPAGVQRGADNLKEAGIEGLVCIGGDGTFRGAKDLSQVGVPCIGIPATIDNDIASTDYAIGFDTAVDTVVGAVDKFRNTSESHDRCAVIEVMGRQAGDLALHAGIAGGAEVILTTDFPFDLEKDVFQRISKISKTGKNNFIVLAAEGVTGAVEGQFRMDIFQLAKRIEEETGIESRAAVLAHMQRGGNPTGRDRVLGSKYGNQAVLLLKEGVGNRVLAERKGDIVDFDIVEALDMVKQVDAEMFQLAKEISI